jgi:phosphate transport system substrate-binding protein
VNTQVLYGRWPFIAFAARPLQIVALFSSLLLLLVACSSPFDSTSAPLSGTIQVDGSTALQPLVTKAAGLFEQAYPNVHITVNGGGSVTGLNDVSSHKVDIGDSDIYANPATYPDPDLTDHLVCVIPFTMIVSSDVPVTNLTKQEIVDIFTTGKYTNWDQLNGPDLRIVPIVRPPTSGTRATFRRYVLSGRDELSNLITISSSQDVVKTVANTRGAIGYLAASVLNPQVHALSIDGYTATLPNIEAGSYTFWSYEHMYTLTITNGGPVDVFLKFMLTLQVRQQAQTLHYIPTSDLKFSQLSSNRPATALNAPYFLEERKRYIR